MNKRKTLIAECRDCKKETRHHILFSISKKDLVIEAEDDHPPIYEHEYYMIIECAGCSQFSFFQRTFADNWTDEGGNPLRIDIVYPSTAEANTFNYLRGDEQGELPSLLSSLYEEVRSCLLHNSNVLAGIGLRTLVEALCLQQNIQGRNLQEKIKNLQDHGLISSTERPILDKLRLIGNFSAHQIKSFPIDKLEYALDIVNHVLRSVYILPKINRKLTL